MLSSPFVSRNTWNTWNKESPYPITHPEYVESLGIPAGSVDYNTGVEIDPDGKVLGLGGHSSEPFIAADPRLKHVEGDFFSFGHTMSSFAHTNNMDPYDALWAKEADVAFDQGPLQNTPNPTYSAVVQPSNVGLHGAHTGRRSLLSFLDAHVNGVPVRSNGGEVLSRYGMRKSPEFGQPVTIAVHDPAHLAAAIEAAEHPMGQASSINELIPRIQSGEVAAPPGINPQTLQPEPGAFPEPPARTAGLWGDLGAAALGAGALALAPETGGASLVGDAALEGGLEGGAAAAGGAAGDATAPAAGLMQKAMSGGSTLTKDLGVGDIAKGVAGMGEKALGMGGGEAGGGGAPYSGPLQQFSSVLAALVESDYETPSSVPDIGVKHDDPEDVDQKEFNDQDKSPENPLNPNLQDSGASGEDQVRKDADKPSQGQFNPDSAGFKRMEMLMPLIEKYYHSDESGANDPMLKGLHEMLEAENPGYLQRADPEAAERFMQNRRKPEHVHAAIHELWIGYTG